MLSRAAMSTRTPPTVAPTTTPSPANSGAAALATSGVAMVPTTPPTKGRLTIVDLATAEHALESDAHDPRANWSFHRALYRASGWDRAIAVAESLHATVALYTEAFGGQSRSDDQHHALLEACRRRAAREARRVLTVHLDDAAAALRTALQPGAPDLGGR
jgi:DNA-binding FadR family transcriptional regulator